MDIFNAIYKDTLPAGSTVKKQHDELSKLYQYPKRDKGLNIPHYPPFEKNDHHQADILYMPEDKGYKFCLVVVDIGSRKVDAEPLKQKTSESVVEGFKKIYSRNYLKIPKRMNTDPGSEFKGKVKDYFNGQSMIKYGKPGRHRQQGLVEGANRVIGTVLHMRMTAQELLTGQTSREWVDDLPLVIKEMNKRALPPKPRNDDVPVCEGDSCDLIPTGSKVRVMLDEPIDVTNGKRLHGKFRASDIRWHPDIRIVKDILLAPGQTPQYLLDKKGTDQVDMTTAYTKNQLQIVGREGKLITNIIRGVPETYIVEEILDKKKEKNKIFYQIKWKGYDEPTWEPATTMKQDIPEMVKEFEESLKNN